MQQIPDVEHICHPGINTPSYSFLNLLNELESPGLYNCNFRAEMEGGGEKEGKQSLVPAVFQRETLKRCPLGRRDA